MQYLSLAWQCLCRNLPGLLLWSGLGCAVGLALGILATVWCHRRLVRAGWLDLDHPLDPMIRACTLALWVAGVPVLLTLTGLTLGLAVEARAFIHNETLVEDSCKLAVGSLVALAVSAADQPSAQQSQHVAVARELLDQGRKIPLDRLQQSLENAPAWLEQGAVELATRRVKADQEGAGPALTRFVLRWTLGWWARSSVESRLRVLRPVMQDLRARDAASDGDGCVAIDEVAGAVSRIHLKPHVEHFVFGLVAAHALSLLGTLALLVSIPVLAARATAWGLRWWRRRSAAGAAPAPADAQGAVQ